MINFLFAVMLTTNLQYALSVRTRFADGTPASVTVIAKQAGEEIGRCETNKENGRCRLSFTIKSGIFADPVLEIVGHPFAPVFGLHGNAPTYIFDYKERSTLGFVINAPGTEGVVSDRNPESDPPIPFWRGMLPAQQAQALTAVANVTVTAKAITSITAKSASPIVTVTPTPSATFVPTAIATLELSATPLSSLIPTQQGVTASAPAASTNTNNTKRTSALISVIAVIVFIIVAYAFTRKRKE